MVRELYGSMLHFKANSAWLVALSGGSKGVHEFINNKPIRVYDVHDVISLMKKADSAEEEAESALLSESYYSK